LNLGAEANWDDGACGCWKRREEDGCCAGLVAFEVMKRCGDGVWAYVRLCEALETVSGNLQSAAAPWPKCG